MMRYCQAIMRNSSNSIEPTVDRSSGGTSFTSTAEVDIFLSYFQQNSINQTEMLCIELEKLGIRTWWDKKELNLTEDSMMKAVESCKLFVLFMNRDTLTRDFVCKEVSRALETKKKIVICSECEGEDLYHGWINEEFRKHVQESWPLKVILRNFGCSRRTPVRRLYKYYKRHDWIDVRFDRADLHGTAQKLLECGRKHGLDLKIQEHPCIYPEEGRHDFFITGNMKDIDTLDACRVLAKLLSWKKRCPCLLDEEGDVDETRIREKLMRSHIFLLLLKNERCIEQRNVQVACKIASELGKNAILVNLEEPFNFKAAQEKAKAELKIDYTNIEFVPFTNRREDFEEATLTMVLRRAAGYATWVEGWDSEEKKTSNEDAKPPVEYSVISFLWRSELEMHQDNFLKYGVRTMADLDLVRCDSSNHKDFDFTSDERKRFENFEIHNISTQSNLHDALHKSFDENFDGLISFDEFMKVTREGEKNNCFRANNLGKFEKQLGKLWNDFVAKAEDSDIDALDKELRKVRDVDGRGLTMLEQKRFKNALKDRSKAEVVQAAFNTFDRNSDKQLSVDEIREVEVMARRSEVSCTSALRASAKTVAAAVDQPF